MPPILIPPCIQHFTNFSKQNRFFLLLSSRICWLAMAIEKTEVTVYSFQTRPHPVQFISTWERQTWANQMSPGGNERQVGRATSAELPTKPGLQSSCQSTDTWKGTATISHASLRWVYPHYVTWSPVSP